MYHAVEAIALQVWPGRLAQVTVLRAVVTNLMSVTAGVTIELSARQKQPSTTMASEWSQSAKRHQFSGFGGGLTLSVRCLSYTSRVEAFTFVQPCASGCSSSWMA